MKVVGCFGRKGGSGKTMVSHLLAHGLSKAYGVFTNVVMTDVREAAPTNINPRRDYYISSIGNKSVEEDLQELQRLFDFTSQVPNSIMILDGGANRPNVDNAFAPLCDFLMIPMGTSSEDMDVAASDFWRLSEIVQRESAATDVCIIRNRWPGTGSKRDALLRREWVQKFMFIAERNRMLFPDFVPDMPSLLDMAHANDPKSTPLIDGVSAKFAEIVLRKLGETVPERKKLLPPGFVPMRQKADVRPDVRPEVQAA